MTKYEIIKKIMGSEKISENEKVHAIEMLLKGWSEPDEIKWIWEE
jgi:hypothetical protein